MSQDSRSSLGMSGPSPATGVGDCVGNWLLVQLLSSQRWSRVYRACPAARNDAPADYALKIVDRSEPDNCLPVRLLRREAIAARAVKHANLVCVLACQLRTAPFYLLMPYLAGSTLQRGSEPVEPLPVAHAVWLVRQVASALRELHRGGWRHGDVKPANIHVAPNGHATLLDLGFVRRTDGANAASLSPLGATLDYAAPETFGDTEGLGPASDVYGLGVTLFQLLTGRLPFVAVSPERLVAAHLYAQPPDVRSFTPWIPSSVAALVHEMLDKQAHRRPDDEQLIARLFRMEIETFDDRAAA